MHPWTYGDEDGVIQEVDDWAFPDRMRYRERLESEDRSLKANNECLKGQEVPAGDLLVPVLWSE